MKQKRGCARVTTDRHKLNTS